MEREEQKRVAVDIMYINSNCGDGDLHAEIYPRVCDVMNEVAQGDNKLRVTVLVERVEDCP